MKLVKLFLFAFFMSACAVVGSAQVSAKATSITDQWTLVHSQDGINFYAKKVVCTLYEGVKPFDYVVLKVENTTNETASISFELGTILNGECFGCGSNEAIASITLAPNAVIENNCSTFSQGMHGLIQNRMSKTVNRFDGIQINTIKISKK
ncbi:MAG: hypothetical protein ACEQR5_02565 [Moraxellaceae bacterium]|jgi:hypothetical protein